jgi:hypothetical protein
VKLKFSASSLPFSANSAVKIFFFAPNQKLLTADIAEDSPSTLSKTEPGRIYPITKFPNFSVSVPPAMEGTIEMSSPSFTAVDSFCI